MRQGSKKKHPDAKMVPAGARSPDVFGCLRDEIEIVGDLLSSGVPAEDWELALVTRDERIRSSVRLKTIW
jgi:hypothetical protein